MDFARHNKEVKAVWEAFWAGEPIRMPVITGISDRFFVLNRDTNPKRVSFYDYTNDPRLMFLMQAEFSRYHKFNIIGDHEMGIPEGGWNVNVDFQNYYEAAWLGCSVLFPKGEVPYAVPLLQEDNKHALFERGIPDSFSGIMKQGSEYYERFLEYAKDYTIEGQRITNVSTPFAGTDGMFTIACELRGADNLCIDMYDDPDYYHQLMDYLTEATIQRMRDFRRFLGEDLVSKAFWFADDSILLLSCEMYKEFVLPYHKRLAAALSTMEQRGGVHLCGDATRHFKTIRDELNIYTFDTGFPVDHVALIKELGTEVIIQGGIPAELVKNGTPEEIDRQSKAIIEAVKPLTKRFIYREGNDIPPYTPMEKINALYNAGVRYSSYTT